MFKGTDFTVCAFFSDGPRIVIRARETDRQYDKYHTQTSGLELSLNCKNYIGQFKRVLIGNKKFPPPPQERDQNFLFP
jgi:hypothetical protein